MKDSNNRKLTSDLGLILEEVKHRWNQEPHSCLDMEREAEYPHLELKTENGGGGNFMVMSAFEVAISDEKEIEELCYKLRHFYKEYCEPVK